MSWRGKETEDLMLMLILRLINYIDCKCTNNFSGPQSKLYREFEFDDTLLTVPVPKLEQLQ